MQRSIPSIWSSYFLARFLKPQEPQGTHTCIDEQVLDITIYTLDRLLYDSTLNQQIRCVTAVTRIVKLREHLLTCDKY